MRDLRDQRGIGGYDGNARTASVCQRRLHRWRTFKLVVVMSFAAGLLTSPALDARPRISSFYAKDEGARIVLQANWCVSIDEVGDSLISTFRLWDVATDQLLVQQRVSGRARFRCNTASLRLLDGYAPGTYSANVAVTNRTTGAFVRIAARYFLIF